MAGGRIAAGELPGLCLDRPRAVCIDAVLMRVEACQQRCERGSLQAGRDVAVPEAGRLGCQPVQVRRLDDLVSHEAEIAPGLVA